MESGNSVAQKRAIGQAQADESLLLLLLLHRLVQRRPSPDRSPVFSAPLGKTVEKLLNMCITPVKKHSGLFITDLSLWIIFNTSKKFSTYSPDYPQIQGVHGDGFPHFLVENLLWILFFAQGGFPQEKSVLFQNTPKYCFPHPFGSFFPVIRDRASSVSLSVFHSPDGESSRSLEQRIRPSFYDNAYRNSSHHGSYPSVFIGEQTSVPVADGEGCCDPSGRWAIGQ